MSLSKVYEHEAIEARWYPVWLERGYFKAEDISDKPPFCLVIPPPNVTGSLHMGHALTLTIEDDRGGTWEIALDEVGADANVCCVATIDNSGDDVELINTSKTGLLHGLDNLEQLVSIAQES